ncbi:ATP-binding cassette domain-containing protein [Candidatus Vampirococcus lugosii]|uniref:ABC transporter n=1 Tax=Candidatus Vampirococcus lugosii TaxID=2789015 RepID=A0ABS5QKA4_9BACT|nr:ATP-binding cassette domain-containing protein [Candidatus Vampirococcus lugosii]MBS8121682.1 ABC transporter [Candidatus Vampirococcus lugosii]
MLDTVSQKNNKKPIIEIEKLSFSHNKGQECFFENLDIKLSKSDLLVIFGKSGSGKTSFLNILGSLNKPISGKIFYNGLNIFEQKKSFLQNYRNSKIGFAFQDFRILDDFSVYENIVLPFYIGKFKKDIDWINYLIDYFEVSHLLNKNIKYISGGEKERVSLLKSFAHKPQIVLLDEPGSYLNQDLKNKIFDFIYEYSQNNICVIVSHDNYLIDYFSLNKFIENKDLTFYKK